MPLGEGLLLRSVGDDGVGPMGDVGAGHAYRAQPPVTDLAGRVRYDNPIPAPVNSSKRVSAHLFASSTRRAVVSSQNGSGVVRSPGVR